jgi:ribosomal protein S18 acetylase RimI-like enzyme
MTTIELPQLAGFTFRRFRGEADYEAIANIQNASNRTDLIEEVVTLEDIANEYTHLVNCDPDNDFIFAEVDGQSVAYARVAWRINTEGQRLYWQWGHVLPEWRRKGIGSALLSYTEARARWHATANPFTGPSFLRGVGEDTAYGKMALFEGRQYPTIRYFCFMGHKDLDNLPEARLPDGLELRAVQPGDMRAIWDAKEEAFQDHWGFTPKTEADYLHWLHQPDNDMSLWQIAWDKEHNRIAGVSLNGINAQDNQQFGFVRGWVNTLGVRRNYRGRGLARSLLVSGMQVLRERGMTEAVLGVDAENPTGALKLYESVGYRILNKDAIYQKPI